MLNRTFAHFCSCINAVPLDPVAYARPKAEARSLLPKSTLLIICTCSDSKSRERWLWTGIDACTVLFTFSVTYTCKDANPCLFGGTCVQSSLPKSANKVNSTSTKKVTPQPRFKCLCRLGFSGNFCQEGIAFLQSKNCCSELQNPHSVSIFFLPRNKHSYCTACSIQNYTAPV